MSSIVCIRASMIVFLPGFLVTVRYLRQHFACWVLDGVDGIALREVAGSALLIVTLLALAVVATASSAAYTLARPIGMPLAAAAVPCATRRPCSGQFGTMLTGGLLFSGIQKCTGLLYDHIHIRFCIDLHARNGSWPRVTARTSSSRHRAERAREPHAGRCDQRDPCVVWQQQRGLSNTAPNCYRVS